MAEPDSKRLPISEVDAGFGHWLAGFIDGEGTFVINEQRRPTGAPKYNCVFRVNVRDDDVAIINEIHRRAGFGRVYRLVRTDGGDQISWTVQTKADCIRLAHLLARFPLRAKKSRDLAIWREAVIAWSQIRPGSAANDWGTMARLRSQLNRQRIYQRVLTNERIAV